MKTTNYLRISLLSATLALGTVNAQTTTNPTMASATVHADEGRGFGFNPSWLGLLGLAGLIGLRRRNTAVYSGLSPAIGRT